MVKKRKTDEEIVQIVRSEDKEMYTELVYRYEDKLLRYARYLSNDEDIANDAVQDAFIKAFTNLKGFDTNKKFSSWIYRIVHNEVINAVKKDSKLVFDFDFSFFTRETAPSPESAHEKEETTQIVKSCMSELSLKYKDVLTLYYLEDKQYDEISDILRMPIGTVGTRINRGKKLLKEICLKKQKK